ncbi:MAG: Serine/threonine-protein kinase AfsK, partial [Verrucomicrobiota bacterium]
MEVGPPTEALVAAWSIDSGTPAPAWATEARGSLWQKIDQPFVPRAADDLAPHPILAGDVIVFGTTLDEVRCVDRRTGATRWNHFCGGPVRYAPTVAGDRVVVGADDGWIRALRLSDGRQLWAVRIGPEQPWISGNGRLISPHPIRSGLLVAEGTVYATAGLFPLEGTYLVALNLTDGTLRWRRLLGNVSPQGYLVDAGADLIVPNGRASPRVYSRSNGDFRRELNKGTGTLAVVSDGEAFTGPGATGAITSGSTATPPTGTGRTSTIISYPGRNLAVTPTTSYLVNEREILAVDRERLRTGKGDLVQATRWKRAASGAGPLIVAGSHVFLGVSNTVQILRADNGEPGPTLTVDGPVFALAADDRTLAVSTSRGRITTFIPRDAGPSSPPAPSLAPAVMAPTKPAAPLTDVVRTALGRLPAPRGWGLYQPSGPVGTDDVLPALMAGSELQWVIAVPTAEVDAARRHLHGRGWLGTSAAVVEVDGPDPVPVADHLFNLVVGSTLS